MYEQVRAWLTEYPPPPELGRHRIDGRRATYGVVKARWQGERLGSILQAGELEGISASP